MSISDAKDVPSWQIGFEDGIKFLMKHYTFIPIVKENPCGHLWLFDPYNQDMLYCTYCKMEKRK